MLGALHGTEGCLDDEGLIADAPRHGPSARGLRFVPEVRKTHAAVGLDTHLHIGHPLSAKRVAHGVAELSGRPPPWLFDRF